MKLLIIIAPMKKPKSFSLDEDVIAKIEMLPKSVKMSKEVQRFIESILKKYKIK